MNTSKTSSKYIHLNNNQADYELNVSTSDENITFDKTPKYLGVILNRTLSYKKHLLTVTDKTRKRCSLLKRLASNRWGADFVLLRTSAMALCYSVAEYCSPVWRQSTHCKKLDVCLNECMRLISGSIKSTPTALLPILSGIEPPDIPQDRHILNMRKRAIEEDSHLFHHPATTPLINIRLKSRMPLSTQMNTLSSQANNTTPDTWMKSAWKCRWNNSNYILHTYLPTPSNKPLSHNLKR